MLYWIYQTNLLLHILAGTIALLTLSMPYFAKKGSKNHKKIGRWFINSMFIIGNSGAFMALMIIFTPVAVFFPEGLPENYVPTTWAENNQSRGLFLLNIAALVLVSVRYSLRVLSAGKKRIGLKTPLYLLELITPTLLGIALFIVGWMKAEVLYMVFAGINLSLSFGYLKYVLKAEPLTNEHIIEHFSGITSASIACITAFTVTGANRLLGIDGFDSSMKLLVWLSPSVIGTVLAIYGQFHFRKKFKVVDVSKDNNIGSEAVS